jgi:elongation factor Ts
MITTEQVKDLRDKTGISVMQCRKALEEAGGDIEKALIILRKKSGEMAAKKSDRTFHSGAIQSYIHSNGTVGSMVILMCETDFVSGNDEFKAVARDIAMHVAAIRPKYLKKEEITAEEIAKAKEVFINEMNEKGDVKNKPQAVQDKILEGKLNAYFAEQVLLNQPFIKNPDITIQGLLDGAMQKFGEKIEISKFTRLVVGE